MKITYDPQNNIAYIALKEKTANVNSIKISEEVVIDIAEDGSIYGVELLNANEQLNKPENGKLEFINLLSGVKQDYIFPI
jgi:uncharacterized protein YuzE